MGGKKTIKNAKVKNFKHGQNFGGNINVNRVSFVGWWLDVFFFAHSDFRVDRIPELHSA